MKRNLLKKEEDNDPISAVSNLFDVAMVFAVALMVALVTRYNMTEMLSTEDFTMVRIRERRTWRSLLRKAKRSIGTLLPKIRTSRGNEGRRWGLRMNLKMVKLFMFRNRKNY